MSAALNRKLSQAHERLRQGDAAGAQTLCQEVLQRAPRNPDALSLLGTTHLVTGNARDAILPLEQALAVQPRHGAALESLGLAHLMLREFAQAERALSSATAIPGAPASVFMRLGVAMLNQGRHAEAVRALERALALNPRDPDIHLNLGLTAVDGKDTVAARRHFEAALRLAPDLNDAHEGLAFLCIALGRFKEGILHLREILRTDPQQPGILRALADALFEVGELDEAETVANRALALDDSASGAYTTLADIQAVRGELDRVVATLQSGIEHTGAVHLLGKLAYQLRRLCDWEKWRSAWERLDAALPGTREPVSPFSLLCEPLTAAQQLAYARRWSEQFDAIGAARDHPPAGGTQRAKLRIGYFSSDFYEHATAYLLAEVLELHDRSRFEIFAYSYGPEDHSPMRARLRAACEHFIDIARDPDDVAANRIRNDELDILIDLKGYTMGARPAILARRPCAIQASWVGYPGTMGATFIDYLIADAFIIPPEHAHFYTERVLRLPHCYQPNDRARAVATPLTRAAYGLPERGFVFCGFNQTYKITPEIFACWMNLLRWTPESALWLLADNRWATENLARAAQNQGIDPARLVFAPKVPLAEHLARYTVADLALDTHPYGSHTTASDALWAGCLLVGLCGETFASRVSGSILRACNLPELVTHTLEEYERLALQLAADERCRNALCAKLKSNKLSAPLFDSRAFTRDLEQLYSDLAGRR